MSVVQLVERGGLSLDEDVREKLPELKDVQILQAAEQGYSKLSPVEGKLTLRYFYPLEQTTLLTSDDTDCNLVTCYAIPRALYMTPTRLCFSSGPSPGAGERTPFLGVWYVFG